MWVWLSQDFAGSLNDGILGFGSGGVIVGMTFGSTPCARASFASAAPASPVKRCKHSRLFMSPTPRHIVRLRAEALRASPRWLLSGLAADDRPAPCRRGL